MLPDAVLSDAVLSAAVLHDDARELIARCLAGQEAAMRELVDRYRGQVFGLCYRMLYHQQDAEDAAQETFVRALRGLKNWDSNRDFTPWLLAIAGNRCRTLLAARMRRLGTSAMLEQLPDESMNLEAAKNLAEEVDRALAALRFEYRQAFVLFHEQEMSYEEIGASLDCPLGTVKTWVHRARRELIQRLSERGVVQAQEFRHAVPRVPSPA